MLKRIRLKNFQIHKNKEIVFTKGINVIVGENNRGKSAIIRALYMVLENLPRGADKAFHREKSKLPLEIELEDDQGNIIKRKKKKYYLNGVLYKAFNNEVPQPIKEILPLKSINWHKQLDSHFLILNTPGAAAKSLGVSTGLEEQESIIKEIKERLSENKSEIKRLHTNQLEAKETMKELRPVVSCLLQARSIKEKQNKREQQEEEINNLTEIVNNLEKLEQKTQKVNLEKHLTTITQLLDLYKQYEGHEHNHEKIVDILERLEDTGNIHVENLNKHITTISCILTKLSSLSENESSYTSVQQTLETIQQIDESLEINKKEIVKKEKEVKQLMTTLGVCKDCPLF